MGTKQNHKLWKTLIKRDRLLKELQPSLESPLTLIIAAAGYGKTTLISQFVQSVDIPSVWQTLEIRDQDVPTLFANSLDTLAQLIPEIAALNPVDGTAASELAILTTDYLRKNIADDFLYIIDDIHLLLDAPNAQIWLNSLIATLPPTCHLILIGQGSPSLSIEKMIVRGELVSIAQDQLSFTLEEISTLARNLGAKLAHIEIETLFARMLGWPAGTILALQPLPTLIENTLFGEEKAPEALFAALANRLFHTQSAALQTFLLRSSTLIRMTPELCKSALGLINSSSYLAEVLQNNLFIAEVSGGLVYHSLFRTFLQRKFQQDNSTEFIDYHTRAGNWFESENRLDEAIEHYIVGEQWELATHIIENTAHIYVNEGKQQTLLRWEIVFKKTQHIHAPRFFHFCAMIHRDRYEYDLALSNAEIAENGFRTDGNHIGLVQIALLRATIDNQKGNFQQALDQAEPFSRDLSLKPNLRGYAFAIIGTAALYLNDLDKAQQLLEDALSLWRTIKDPYATAQLLMTLEVTYLRLGRFSDASRCVQEVLYIRRAFGETVGILMALNNLGYQQSLLGEYQSALQTLHEGLSAAKRVPENRAESHILWTIGDLERDRGAFVEANRHYHKAIELIHENEPFLRANLLISLATLQRWEGNLDQSQQLVSEAKELAKKHNLNWDYKLAQLAEDALQTQQGKFELVRSHLESTILDWTVHPSPQLVHAIGVYAHGALLSDDIAVTHKVLKLALTNANHPANLRPLVVEIAHTPLLRKFIEAHKDRYGLFIDKVGSLDDMQRVKPNLPNTSTYDLRISILGSEHIERDGVSIPLSNWQAASARELFFYLLFKRACSREEIGLALWPDSSSQQVRQKFHSTLGRIRDAIGTNAIVFEDELYSINPNITVWCDAIEFQSFIRQARLNSPLLTHTEHLWIKAINLYRGDFLPAFDVDWVSNYRESLRQMYVDSLLGLSNCICFRGEPQAAINHLKQALKIEPYREDIHRALFECYYLIGENGLISQHVSELKRLFNEDLGTNPSIETMQLIQQFLR